MPLQFFSRSGPLLAYCLLCALWGHAIGVLVRHLF